MSDARERAREAREELRRARDTAALVSAELPSDDLVSFLRARLDEDEEVARQTRRNEQRVPHTERWFASHNDAITSMAPHRAVVEVEAKGRLMSAHARPHECIALTGSGDRSVADGQPWELWEPEHTADHGPCYVLRCLALPYADHPEYDDSWRP